MPQKLWLKIDNLSCRKGARILFAQFNLSLASGEIISIYGANGCGKTSLGKIITGLSSPLTGEVSLSEPKNILYLGHQLALKNFLTVEENLKLYAELNDINLNRLSLSLNFFDLNEHHKRMVKNLSCGEQKRLALSRILLDEKPKFILLEEPESALDENGKENLKKALKQKLEQGSIIITFSPEAYPFAQRQLLLSQYKESAK